MESEQHDERVRPTWEEVFQAFDNLDLRDFEIERDHSLPREVDLDLTEEQADNFIQWISSLSSKADSLRE